MSDFEKHEPLSAQSAFVVHFRSGIDVATKSVAGRVEHVVSGKAVRFQSLDELLTFVAQVLSALATARE